MPIATIDAIVMNDSKFLLLKRNNPPLNDEWFTPGSRILLGESLEDAVKRTLFDETGLTAIMIEQKGTMSQIFESVQSITTFYLVKVSTNNVILNRDHSEFKWISGMDENLNPYVKTMIESSKLFYKNH